MGDRCSVEILCHKDDAKRFETLGFVRATWGEQPDNLVRMFEEQADYAAESDLRALAKAGVVFIGASGAGDDYSAALFAGDGKRFVSVNSHADSIGSKPVVEIDADGIADPAMMKAIKRYYKALKAAKKMLGIA